jgi:hypothetical protein|tara:strand:- start:2913 stop:3581 length:669 start_codon:yes stop_codon:yes gene_type:complete
MRLLASLASLLALATEQAAAFTHSSHISAAAHPTGRAVGAHRLVGDASAGDQYCAVPEREIRTECRVDYARLCGGGSTNGASLARMLECFDARIHQSYISPPCVHALESLTKCLYSPKALAPFELMVFLLLCAVSGTCLCAIARCLARCLATCQRVRPAPLSEQSDLSSALSDGEVMGEEMFAEPGLVSKSDGEGGDDAHETLPSYTEAVEGATLSRNRAST